MKKWIIKRIKRFIVQTVREELMAGDSRNLIISGMRECKPFLAEPCDWERTNRPTVFDKPDFSLLQR